MPPRNPELPEGTDHIINGAMETGAGADASTGSSGGAPGGDGGAPIGGGFVATTGATGDDTGGTATGGGSGGGTGGGSGGGSGGTGGGGGGGAGSPVKQQLTEGVQSLKQQATDKVRTVADDGKARATSALDDLSRMMNEAGETIDERLGGQYGDYARRAAEAVTGLSDSIRDKEIEELWDDARGVLRKSPGVALGVAAVVGFTLARLIKAGTESGARGGDGGNVGFQPEGGRNIEFQADTGGSGGSSAKSA